MLINYVTIFGERDENIKKINIE